jgi:hypothetical protein
VQTGNDRNDHAHPGASAVAAIVIREAHGAVVQATVVGAARQIHGLVPIATIAVRIDPPGCVPDAIRGRGACCGGLGDGGTIGRPFEIEISARPWGHRWRRSLENAEI